jgi:uncharacterized protein YraI
MAKKSPRTTFLENFWVPLIIALISLFGVIFSVEYGSREARILLIRPTPTSTPVPFSYQVRVEAKDTGENVPNAEVTIEVSGKASLDGITDTNGIARIFIDPSHAGQPGFLFVEATGYERYRQHIDLIVGALPDVVLLGPEPVISAALTAKSTPTSTPIPTFTSILTPTHTPTPTPTDTPTSLLSMTTSTSVPTTPTPEAMVVSANGLNLRSGPGIIYNPPIGYLRNGDMLDIRGRIASNEWIQVVPIAEPGMLGWVSASPKYVHINMDLSNIPIVESPPTPLPTLTAPILASAPALLEPPDGTSIALPNRLDLAWTWDRTLGPNDYFQVEIWNRYNDFAVPTDVAWVKSFFYKYDRVEEGYDREYRWRITVVRGIPAGEKSWSTPDNRVWEPGSQFQLVSEEGVTWTLFVEPGTAFPPPSPPEPKSAPELPGER